MQKVRVPMKSSYESGANGKRTQETELTLKFKAVLQVKGSKLPHESRRVNMPTVEETIT